MLRRIDPIINVKAYKDQHIKSVYYLIVNLSVKYIGGRKGVG
jgi:hypothetical protein